MVKFVANVEAVHLRQSVGTSEAARVLLTRDGTMAIDVQFAMLTRMLWKPKVFWSRKLTEFEVALWRV